MALFNFNLAFYAFSDFSAGANTNDTVGYPTNSTFTLDAAATAVVINITDHDQNPVGSPDNLFSDGFIDIPGDGSPSKTASNDQVLTNPVTVNGTTYPAVS